MLMGKDRQIKKSSDDVNYWRGLCEGMRTEVEGLKREREGLIS